MTTLTPHFTLENFTRSYTSSKFAIDNFPPVEAISNMQCLCQHVLEPLRDWYGQPVLIGSGFRCRELNKRLGGAPDSQHLTGEAADLCIPYPFLPVDDYARQLRRLYDYVLYHMTFDRLIWEQQTSRSIPWLHVSFRRNGENRKQAF